MLRCIGSLHLADAADKADLHALGAIRNVRLWLQADIRRVTPESPLFPRKRTSSAQERFGLKKRTLDVCLTPNSGRKSVRRWESAYDPTETFNFEPSDRYLPLRPISGRVALTLL